MLPVMCSIVYPSAAAINALFGPISAIGGVSTIITNIVNGIVSFLPKVDPYTGVLTYGFSSFVPAAIVTALNAVTLTLTGSTTFTCVDSCGAVSTGSASIVVRFKTSVLSNPMLNVVVLFQVPLGNLLPCT